MKRKVMMLGLLSLCGFSQAAQAWYVGDWKCTIDGRAGWMVWHAEDSSQPVCRKGSCTRMVYGAFKDSRGPGSWIKLAAGSQYTNDLRFIYMGDMTPWFLNYDPNTGVATGNTLWHGKTYPLQCVRD